MLFDNVKSFLNVEQLIRLYKICPCYVSILVPLMSLIDHRLHSQLIMIEFLHLNLSFKFVGTLHIIQVLLHI
jgi:hypothetical protein